VTWRQSATDANNHLVTNVAAGYVQESGRAVDNMSNSSAVSASIHFDLRYHDNRAGTNSAACRQAGIAARRDCGEPLSALSIYGSYSIS